MSDTDKHDQAEMELVAKLISNIKASKKHFEKPFARMKKDMDLVFKGHDEEVFDDDDVYDDELYVANVVHRHIQQRTASLYAKNPQAIARMPDRKVFAVWDETPESLMQAQQALMAYQEAVLIDPATPKPQNAVMLLQDYQEGTAHKALYQGIADTLVILFHYFMSENEPGFKRQMKQLVRRTLTTGVGYVKLGFQRAYTLRPETAARIDDFSRRLAHIDRLVEDLKEGEIDKYSAEAKELELALEKLQEEEKILIREGLIFEFPKSNAIIVDPKCVSLDGFVGASWAAQEYAMSEDEIEETYGVKLNRETVAKSVAEKEEEDTPVTEDNEGKKSDHLVWDYYDRTSGLVYTVSSVFDGFLEDPKKPDIAVDGFFPFKTLMFNPCEHDDEIYPPSDVRLMRSQQLELNRTRQSNREHRIASVPQYVATDAVSEEDLNNVTANVPHAVVKANSLMSGQKLEDVVQQIKKAPIDPNHYTTNHLMEDVFLVVGSQEADLGAVSGATATETSLAASSRSAAIGSNVDDLDDFFTSVARSSGQILLREMTKDKVEEIVGPGAVWGEFSNEEIAKEVYLEIEAGSSGRPNKAEDIAMLERILPHLLQMQDINQLELAKETLRRYDDKMDLNKLIMPGTPSAVALNQLKQNEPAASQDNLLPGQSVENGVYTDSNKAANDLHSVMEFDVAGNLL